MILTVAIHNKSDILLKAGQEVNFTTPFFKQKKSENVKIQLSKKLNTQPKKIFRYLKKFVGEDIKSGEILAENKGLFSINSIASEFDGIIKEINHEEGCVVIRKKTESDSVVNAYFKGEIESVDKDEIKIKIKDAREYSLKTSEVNGDFGGEIYYFKGINSLITEDDIKNKIIVAENIDSYSAVKLEALGSKGFATLYPPGKKTEVNYVQLKNIEDFEEIMKLQFPYCIVSQKNNKIYFYT